MRLTRELEQYSIKHLQEELRTQLEEDCANLKKYHYTIENASLSAILSREAMVSYKHTRNLTELPLGSVHAVTAIGHLEHYG